MDVIDMQHPFIPSVSALCSVTFTRSGCWYSRCGDDAVASIRLCLVECSVSGGNQVRERASMGGVRCDADGYSDGAEVLSPVLDGELADFRSQLFGAAD